MRPLSPSHVIAGFLLALLSCGSNDVGASGHSVGARCAVDKDCAKRCLTTASFPGGYCTETCTTASDCPGGSACIMGADATGLCVATCHVANDCDGFGAGYLCSRRPRQEGGEGVLVCIGAG